MTQTFAVNDNNDLFIDANGNLSITSGLEAVLQNCEHAAKAQLGEMVLDTTRGIPNFDTIWVGVPNIPQFEAALGAALRNVTDVIDVISLVTRLEQDVLIYEATIKTIYGVGVING
jgi:hypothetical protein